MVKLHQLEVRMITDFQYRWGPWAGFSYQKVEWFYDHKNWDVYYKHFLQLGPFFATWRTKEHVVR